jgi:multiple sugar transport system permease protein
MPTNTKARPYSVPQGTLARQKKIRLNIICWVFMLPTVLSYLVFQGIPIVTSIWYSFLDWSGLSRGSVFVGGENYKELLGDKLFWQAFKNSFIYMLEAVPLFLIVSLVFAYILNNERLRGRTIFRTVYFIPVITTTSIIGIVMIFIWGASGPINTALLNLGVIKTAARWLGDGKTAMPTVVLISVWKDLGTYMIYWLAGLTSIPQDIYEAAEVDGAGKTRTLVSIVLPMMLPVAGTITLLNIINSLKVFDIIKTMTNGGPFYATDVMGTYIYRMAFSSEMGMPRLGYSCAASVMFGLTVILLTLVLQNLKKFLAQAARQHHERKLKNTKNQAHIGTGRSVSGTDGDCDLLGVSFFLDAIRVG